MLEDTGIVIYLSCFMMDCCVAIALGVMVLILINIQANCSI